MWKVILPVALVLLLAGQALAQSDDEQRARDAEAREQELDQRLEEAERSMAEAARRIAEITSERLPHMESIKRRFEFASKPRLGVMIERDDDNGPVEGVTIDGVTPGSAAAEAGLRSGDIITGVNSESLSAGNSQTANERLLDFMKGVEPGDVLKIEYLRDGKVGSVEVEPRIVDRNVFVWKGDGGPNGLANAPNVHVVPEMMKEFRMDFDFPWVGSGLGELELVELNAGLGRYFGTDTGLLVISAPESDTFELQDGDVIQSIDGRQPKDVRHAMRILGSYQAGETLKLGIVRDKKKRTLDVEIPAKQSGMLFEVPAEVSPATILIAP
ncbi:MAG: PDZ domain-containing protein, partial [Gammaproteobacteria bacterium]|nr:PDZ domain-containing protein [Gammaproteobacteria bacterium]